MYIAAKPKLRSFILQRSQKLNIHNAEKPKAEMSKGRSFIFHVHTIEIEIEGYCDICQCVGNVQKVIS